MTTVVFDGKNLVADGQMTSRPSYVALPRPGKAEVFCKHCGENHDYVLQHVGKIMRNFNKAKVNDDDVIAISGAGPVNLLTMANKALRDKSGDALVLLEAAINNVLSYLSEAAAGNLNGAIVVIGKNKETSKLSWHRVVVENRKVKRFSNEALPLIVGSGTPAARLWGKVNPEATALEMVMAAIIGDDSSGGTVADFDCDTRELTFHGEHLTPKQMAKGLRKGYIKKSRAIEVPRITLPNFEENKDGQDKRSGTKED